MVVAKYTRDYEKTTSLKFTGRLFYNEILQINGVDNLL